MNLSKENYALQITTCVTFDARTALDILGSVFMPNGHHVLGNWCKSIEAKCLEPVKDEDKWLAIPCGGILVFHTEVGDVELDLERLAQGFNEWYENIGHRYVPLRMNANGNLQFDAYGLRASCPDEIDPMMQTCLFGFVKFEHNAPSKPVAIIGKGGEKAKMEAAVKNLFEVKNKGHSADISASASGTGTNHGYRCNKCVKERICTNPRPNCTDFVRDPPDGGYYG